MEPNPNRRKGSWKVPQRLNSPDSYSNVIDEYYTQKFFNTYDFIIGEY